MIKWGILFLVYLVSTWVALFMGTTMWQTKGNYFETLHENQNLMITDQIQAKADNLIRFYELGCYVKGIYSSKKEQAVTTLAKTIDMASFIHKYHDLLMEHQKAEYDIPLLNSIHHFIFMKKNKVHLL